MNRLGRRFVWLCASDAATLLAGAAATTATPVLILSARGSGADLAVVSVALLAAQVLALVFGGLIADRRSRRDVMLLADLMQAAAAFSLSVTFERAPLQLLPVAAFTALRGVGLGFYLPASQGILTQVVDAAKIQSANSIRRIIANVAQIGRAFLGAWLAGRYGSAILTFVGVSCLFGAVSRMGLREIPQVAEAQESWRQAAKQGVKAVVSRPWLLQTVAGFALINAAFLACINVLGPMQAVTHLGGAEVWGSVSAATGVGSVLGAALALRLDPTKPLLRALQYASLIALEPLALAVGSISQVLVAALLTGAGIEVFGVLWVTVLQRSIPSQELSRVFAIDALGSYAIGPVGPVLAAVMVAHTNEVASLASVGGLILLVCVILIALSGSHGVDCASPDCETAGPSGTVLRQN